MLNRFFAFLILGCIFVVSKAFCGEGLFSNLPKGELHLHLGGAFPKDYLLSITTPEQKAELLGALDRIQKGVDYCDAFTIFQIIANVINSEDRLQKGVEALCLFLQSDGVQYVEIRTGLKNLGQGYEEYLKAVLRGISVHTSEQFVARVILSLQRHSSLEMADITVALAKKYHAQGVVGIDISGDSTKGQIEQIMPQLLSAKEAGIPFVIHLGEHPEEINQICLLEQLEPKRVGHAVHLTDDAKAWILQHQIPIEICLSSSVFVNMINQFKHHPGIEFFKHGHPVIFCSDDPFLFTTTTSKELQLSHQFCGLSEADIEEVIHNSFQCALSNPFDPDVPSTLPFSLRN